MVSPTDGYPAKCLDALYNRMLVAAATQTAKRYCAPIYLVGSSLILEDALDLDIFMVVDNRQYSNLIGERYSGTNLHNAVFGDNYMREARLITKNKTYFEGFVHTHDIDFKIETFDRFFKIKDRKIRIDALDDLF